MHEQTRPSIDFDHCASCFMQRSTDVFRHDIDAGDVEANHTRCQCGRCRHIGMHFVSDIEIEVAIALHYY